MWTFPYPQVWFTYGHKTTDESVIVALLEAGATGARLTFSYGTQDIQAERARQLRVVADRMNRKIVIVADLQGEKCRFSRIEGVEKILVRAGEPFLLTGAESELEHRPMKFQIQLPKYLDELEQGDIGRNCRREPQRTYRRRETQLT